MSEQPTPETDAELNLYLRHGEAQQISVSWIEFARKLERERDEAREVLERIARASMSVRHKEEDYAEWEKAIESLLGICEENNFTNE